MSKVNTQSHVNLYLDMDFVPTTLKKSGFPQRTGEHKQQTTEQKEEQAMEHKHKHSHPSKKTKTSATHQKHRT